MFFIFEAILVLNLGGLSPGSAPITGTFAVTFFFSKMVWCEVVILGFDIHGLNFIGHFYMKEKVVLGSFLSIVELLSMFIRLLTLAVRLYANITAGHILIETLFSTWYSCIFAYFSTSYYISSFFFVPLYVFPFFVGSVVLIFYETAVAFVQAYVFVLLSIYYMREPIQMLEHGHGDFVDYYEQAKLATYKDRENGTIYWLPDGNVKYLKYISYPSHVRKKFISRFATEEDSSEDYEFSQESAMYARHKLRFSKARFIKKF